ncbi:MAG: YlxR family protein [Clostridia bacterium]|nr:YlxR family protein [Clostridia bacterium]
MPAKKEPLRQCIGCMEMKSKKELVRIVKNKLGEVSLDTTGKAQGRGAYICPNPECLKKTIKSRRLEKVFEMKIPEEILCEMQRRLEE